MEVGQHEPVDSKRYVGMWWVPSAPDQAVGGILETDEYGASRLELTAELHGGKFLPLVHGTADGRAITLLDCSPDNGGKITIAQFHSVTEVMRPQVALVGVHLETRDQPVFKSIEYSVSNLTVWSRSTGLEKVDYYDKPVEGADDQNYKFKRSVVTVTPTSSITARLDDAGETFKLGWSLVMSGPKNDEWARKFHVEEAANLIVTSDENRTWDGFNDSVAGMRDLLTLAVQSPCAVSERTLRIEMEGERPYSVPVYFDTGSRPEPGAVKDNDILFTLADVDFASVIPTWFALRKKIGLPLDVLFGLDYEKSGFYENHVFNAASAAEGFHAALRPESTDIDEELHKTIKQKVKELFTGEARLWVGRQTGDNRPGLKKRLLELTELADPEAMDYLVTNRDTWAKWVRDARNAIGHLNTGEFEKKVPEEGRYRLTYITRAVLHLIMLNELGISPEAQRKAVNDNFGYSARAFKKIIEGTS